MSTYDVEVIEPPEEAVEAVLDGEFESDLHFAFIRHEPEVSGEVLHRAAVIAGVEEFDRRLREHVRAFGRRLKPPPEVDPAQVHGRRVSREAFYGPWFDPDTRRAYGSGMDTVNRLMKEAERHPHLVGFTRNKGPFIWLDEEDPKPFELDPPGDRLAPRGFAEAFLDPVMGPKDDVRDLYHALLAVDDLVLNRPGAETEIYHWDGDWHRYFDAGNEGWGSDAWTVARDATTIVVIGASATD